MPAFRLRPATPDDAEHLVRLIRALADYERLAHEAHPDADRLRRQLAPDATPPLEALIAENEAGEAIGFALYFYHYSTFLTSWGLYLEDLFVVPEARGQGVGFALLRHLARRAVARGCPRLDWAVLDWNVQAIRFYEKLGARPLDDWTTMRLDGEALARLGEPG
ncbi:MAG: GNAT family N-acetyltransferase [Bacteroidetes bacterium]|nr:MAG: GNAT family N-acetyltransferase [Bacteroidota bacterium]GIV58589.1 MAG: N-acetyltransferase [Rhodothermaceae bacterium]